MLVEFANRLVARAEMSKLAKRQRLPASSSSSTLTYFKSKLAECLPFSRQVLQVVAGYAAISPQRVGTVKRSANYEGSCMVNIPDLHEFVNSKTKLKTASKFNLKFATVDWSSIASLQEPYQQLHLVGVVEGTLEACALAVSVSVQVIEACFFVSTTIAFELVLLPEFREGNYAEAVKKLCPTLHSSLLECKDYCFEEGQWLSSGACVAVALITPTTTTFASLGDCGTKVRIRRLSEESHESLFAVHT